MSCSDMYDLILFENFQSAYNHKYDLHLIANLLRSKGLKVAIFNLYGEETEYNDQIPIIEYHIHHKLPDNSWLHTNNTFLRGYYVIKFLWQQRLYMNEVISYIEDKASAFYCGSYHLLMPSVFFSMKKTCYYWGLRSSRMTAFWYHFKKNPLLGFRMLYLKKAFLSNPTQMLFVSNEIIKKEFLNLGIDNNRLVIRDERCIDKIKNIDKIKKALVPTFLIIGGLRRQKRIELSVQAYTSSGLERSRLLVVGENKDEQYEKVIMNEIDNNHNVQRVNRRLKYDEFNNYISDAHFTLFADEQGLSSVTNGTMMESLINMTPIIAPDYPPYSYYIKKYGVGLLYNPSSICSYVNAIVEANALGWSYFYNNICNFLESITFENVASRLYSQLYDKEISKVV